MPTRSLSLSSARLDESRGAAGGGVAELRAPAQPPLTSCLRAHELPSVTADNFSLESIETAVASRKKARGKAEALCSAATGNEPLVATAAKRATQIRDERVAGQQSELQLRLFALSFFGIGFDTTWLGQNGGHAHSGKKA